MRPIVEEDENRVDHFYREGNDIFYFNGKEKVKLTPQQKNLLLFMKEEEDRKNDPTYKEVEVGDLDVSMEDVKKKLKSGDFKKELDAETDRLKFKLSPKNLLNNARKAKIQEITSNIYNFMNNQVEEQETIVRDFRKRNHFQDAMDPDTHARSEHEASDYTKPSVQLYIDRSCSWTGDAFKTEIGDRVQSTLSSFRDSIDFKTYYFDDTIWTEEKNPGGGGTSAGRLISKQIIETKPDNVIIITDSDIYNMIPVEVPGAVWRIFVFAESTNVKESLFGKQRTKDFFFSRR